MSEQIKFRCPFCEQKLEAPKEAVGRRVQCHSCEKKFALKIDEEIEAKSERVGEFPVRHEETPSINLNRSSKMQKKSFPLVAAVFIILLCGGAGACLLYNPETSSSTKQTDAAKVEQKDKKSEVHHSGVLAEVKENCYRCHGKVRNGKPNIKGDFDLTPLLAKTEVNLDDSSQWQRVVAEVSSKRMPPEDSKEELNNDQRKNWVSHFHSKLNKKDLRGRMLTATEIDADHAIIYGYDKDHYNPFETLKLLKKSDARYPTIGSAELMSRTFLEGLQYGLEELVQDYTQNMYRASAGHTARKGESYDCSIRTGVTSSAEKLDDNEKASKYFDFRTWGRQRLYSKGHPRFGIVPGKYRLTFTANSMNRKLIKKVIDQYNNKKDKRFIQPTLDVWGDLYYAKARISLINSGNDNKQSRKDGVFHTFEIEDGVEKEYSCEFTMTTASLLDLSWDNGPYNPRKHWVRLGKEKRGEGEAYNFPCVRIKNVKLTKLDDVSSKSDFDVSYLADKPDKRKQLAVLTEDLAKEKLQFFAKQLGIANASKRILTVFDKLPVDMPLREKYATTIRLISMSADYLYIDCDDPQKGGAERFVSYSLLKKKPSEIFKDKLASLKAGKVSSKEFAQYIISDEGFKNFLKHFTMNWFKSKVALDTKKFNPKLQKFEYYEETVEYLNYLFANNRPLRELFHSNYRVLNSKMAAFYDMEEKQGDGFVKYESDRGGILEHVTFFATQSDGIDGLPFRRAEWISENVFDERLGNPPKNINSEEFEAGKELKTFKERTEFHSQHGACASCHKVIDPIAFAVNHRGTLGRDLSRLSKNAIAVEKSAVEKFDERLSKVNRQIASAFTKHLVSYIVGRELTVFDKLTIEKILSNVEGKSFKALDVYSLVIEHYFK